MNLQHFLTATKGTDDQELRRAMILVLALEIPHDRASYERFHRKVLDVLQTKAEDPADRIRGTAASRIAVLGCGV